MDVTQTNVALGGGAVASDVGAVAIGNHATTARGTYGSVAIGANSAVLSGASNSVALGQNSIASEANTISVGNDTLKRRVSNVADGINPYDAVNMRQLDRVDARISAVGAMSGALSGMIPNAKLDSNTQLSMGLGYYESEVAVAIGAFHYIDDLALLNFGLVYSAEGGTAARLGVTWGF